jgi:hypothetical protein
MSTRLGDALPSTLSSGAVHRYQDIPHRGSRVRDGLVPDEGPVCHPVALMTRVLGMSTC